MSIHFISGKPGGGKSLYGMKLLVDELVHGNRVIVTNLAVRLDELNHYLQEQHEAAYRRMKMVHISERVVLIEEDDLGAFYTFRGEGVRLVRVSSEEWKANKRPDFASIRDNGVFYVLDEIHIPFNARAWATTGAGVIYYLTQHRKLGDDLVCITQHVGNVDKQFRSVAQDFTYIKNLSKQQMGFFRLPSLFLRSTYGEPVTAGSTTANLQESGTFRLDVSGLARCYDTAKGVGIHGRTGADIKARKRGLHWAWFVGGAVGLVWVWLWVLPKVLAKVVAPVGVVAPGKPLPGKVVKPVDGVTISLADGSGGSAPVSRKVPETVNRVTVYVTNEVKTVPGAASVSTNEFWCRGYVMLSKNDGVCYFSDGSSVDLLSGRLTRIEKSFVVLDGVVVPIRRASVVSAARPLQEVETPQLPPPMVEKEMPPAFGGIVVSPGVGGR